MPLSFKYQIISNSNLDINKITDYHNYCLYQAFYLNLNQVLPASKDIPFDDFLKLFGKKDLYSYFTDFLINFPKIKDFLRERIQLFRLRKLYNNWKIGIFLKNEDNTCTELSVLEFKYLNFPQIKRKKFDSIKKSFMTKFNYKDPYLICFLQDKDHFEAIKLTEKLGEIEHSVKIKEFLDEKIFNQDNKEENKEENQELENKEKEKID